MKSRPGTESRKVDLQREEVLAVHVLVQAIVVARAVAQEERGRLGLPGAMTPVEKSRVIVRVAHGDAQGVVPPVGEAGELRIEGRAERGDDLGKRMGEVLVFAAPEAVARHDDPAAEPLVDVIGRRQRGALVGREHRAHDGEAIRIEACGDVRPVKGCDALRDVEPASAGRAGPEGADHEAASRASRARLRSTPHRYPASAPSVRTTRWQGMATAMAFAAHACATARTALGAPMRSAMPA